MNAISVTAPLGAAWAHMKRILFAPFDLGKWFALGFTAWLAQLGQQSGGGNFNVGDSWGRKGTAGREWQQMKHFVLEYLWIIVPVVAALVLLGLALGLVFLWLRSRAKFMFLDNVVRNRAEIREPWASFRRQGNSLFGWSVVYGLVVMLFVLLLLGAIGVIVYGMAHDRAFRAAGIALLIVCGLVLLCFLLLAAYITLFLDHFVVPLMHRFSVGAVEGWRRFLAVFRTAPGGFLLYGLFYFVVGLGIGLVFLLTCCLCCVGMIPYIGTVALLPVAVLLRAYGVEFLHQFVPEVRIETGPAAPPPPPA